MDDLQHPEITSAENTGYPSWVRPMPVCPICGEKCSTIYTDFGTHVVGCDFCLTEHEALEFFEWEE